MNPTEHYHYLINKDVITPDNEQLAVVKKLQHLFEQIITDETKSKLQKLIKGDTAIQGFYLWGGVGTGKTFMIDNFFNCLPISNKLRMHYHTFMQYIHYELGEHEGDADPLKNIAKKIRKKTRILVLDELIVNDITDAMLLAELFKQMFEQKICLLFTTNIHPDDLYINGLQRQRFLPAIELIKQHCEVYHLQIQHDYRQNNLGLNKNYLTPLNEETHAELEKRFSKLTDGNPISTAPIKVHGRTINIVKQAGKTIWYDFIELCNVPRSQRDYIYLTKHYDTIVLSNLRVIKSEESSVARLFINLIDVLYDHRTHLIISAQTNIENIYTQGRLLFPFARTQSRIIEMQADVLAGSKF